jgi:hypothetical protein
VPAAISKSFCEVNFTVNLDNQSAPFATRLWFELDTFDRVSAVCKHCRRSIFIPSGYLRENDHVRCEWCKQEQESWEALLEARPDILQNGAAPAVEAVKNKIVAELERAFRGSGLKMTRR